MEFIQVKLRKLLSDKMDVDEDEVHIELGRMYQAEKVSKDKRNKIIKEIKYLYPQTVLNYEN